MGNQFTGRGDRIATALATALVAFLFAGAHPAVAQQGAITGTVVNANTLEPVAGAQVFIPNTPHGTLTGSEGQFRLTGVPAGQHALRVRIIGFQPLTRQVRVTAGEATDVRLELSVAAVSLEELVVTQTGEQRTRELASDITTVDVASQLEQVSPPTLGNLLQGQSAGTVIRQSSGSVGTGTTFNVRGPSSISLDNTPLIYIDGVLVNSTNQGVGGYSSLFTGGQTTSRLNDIPPENIESIQIIKGPAASTLYGSNAGSGVILIETKSGRGEPRWNFEAQVGGNWDVTDWPALTYKPTADPLVTLPFAKDTLYMMELLEGRHPVEGSRDPFRTGFEQVYRASTNGAFGEGGVTYFLSGTYEDREGNMQQNSVTRYSTRANFGFQADDVSIRLNAGFHSGRTLLPQNDNNGNGYIGNSLLGLAFWTPFMASDPNAGGQRIETCALAFEISRAFGQPLQDATDQNCASPFLSLDFDEVGFINTQEEPQRFTGSVNLTWQPLDFLNGRFTVGYDYTGLESRQLYPVKPSLFNSDDAFRGLITKDNANTQVLTLQAATTADFDLTEDISSEITVGSQYAEEQTEATQVEGREFPAGSPAVNNSVVNEATDSFFEKRTIGLFADQQFSWKDRLFVSGGVRFDDNSAFGAELGMKAFPRAGISYVLSDEEWFPDFFEQFKVRGAWGQSGKQPGTNDALALLSTVSVPFRGSELLGVSPQRPGNVGLEPERDEEIEAGFDFSILDGRVSGTFSWYHMTAENAVVSAPLAPSLGFPGAQITNIGQMVNEGIEASINATAFSRPDLRWTWAFNVSTNYNEITRLDNPIGQGFAQRHLEGHPFGVYYGRFIRLVDGEPVAVDTAQVLPGEPTPTPNVSGSLSSSLTLFDHVTLYALADFATGHEIGNNTESFMCWFTGTCAAAWEQSPDGSYTDHARLIRRQSQLRLDGNSVYPADYVKLRTASIRFQIPQQWLGLFNARRAALTIMGNNLATWTPYSGVDPELNTFGQDLGSRGEFLTLPPARSVAAELSVTF